MTTPLPRGRGDTRRTRLYVRGDWDTPVFDSALSDMHPDDYLLYGPHTELTAVIDIDYGGPGQHFRWSGIWSQKSRRRIERHDSREYLKYMIQATNPLMLPVLQDVWKGYQPA